MILRSLLFTLFFSLWPLPLAQAKVFDGGVDPANLGKGEWLWQLSNCTNKMKNQIPSVTNVPSMMAFFKSNGLQFIIVKAGTGSTNFPSASNKQFTTNLVDAAHAVGIKIFGYTRSYGSDIPGESALADYVFRCGADGFVFDAEGEWETGSKQPWITNGPVQAWKLCGMVKTNWPTKFLAHAPLPIISGHSSFPYKEFGYWCDAVMPQDYWGYWGKTATAAVDWMDSEWAPFQNSLTGIYTNSIKPIAPIGEADTSLQTAASITEFFGYLKTDPNCVTATGYKGCSFWDAEEHYATSWAAIGAGSIGDTSRPPSITSQPQSQTLVVGQTATFSVSADGLPMPTYQWQFNGSNITGATNSSYSLADIKLSDAGSYSVTLTNAAGSLTSSNAVLTVTTNVVAASITTQPQSQTAIAGQNATFNVIAGGTSPFSYQWFFNNSPLTGATDSALAIPSVQLANAGSYSVIVTNHGGLATSDPAILTVNYSLTLAPGAGGLISASPNTPGYAPNDVVLLTANPNPGYAFTGWSGDANGNGNPIAITMTSNKNVSAAFLSTLPGADILIVESRSGGSNYSAYADSSFSDSTLKSSAPGCSPQSLGSRYGYSQACSITLNPALPHPGGVYLLEVTHGSASSISKTIMVNASIQGGMFTNADGTASPSLWTPTFQQTTSNLWKTIGTIALNPGVTQPTLTFTSTNTDFNQSTSRFYSDGYRFTFQPALPVIAAQPASQSAMVGASSTFSVSAGGTPPLTYQWQFGGTNLAGATSSSYTVNNILPANAGTYNVIVASYYGSILSSNAILTVIDPHPIMGALKLLADGRPQFEITGGAIGSNYLIQASEDLRSWTLLTSMIGTNAVFRFSDSATNLPQRFYRLQLGP